MNKFIKFFIAFNVLLHITVSSGSTISVQAQASEDVIKNTLDKITLSSEPYIENGNMKITYPQSEDIEYRFWEKTGIRDWTIVSDFNNNLLEKYQFKTTDTINLQIDARSKKNPSKIYQRWLGQYLVNKPDVNDKLVSQIRLSPQTTTINTGSFLDITSDNRELDLSQTEIMLWEKYGDEDWKISQNYTKWPLKPYEFSKPGKYNLQIDIRDPSNPQKVNKKWLGEFISLSIEDSVPFIKGYNWFPFTVSPLIGTDLKVQALPTNANYEYMLWSKYEDENWKEDFTYQSSSTFSKSLDRLGLYSLQIDVRKKTEPWVVQKYYLGQFYVHDRDREKNSDYLIRRLLSFYSSPVQNDSDVLKSVSLDLDIALNMLRWEKEKIPLDKQNEKLRNLKSIGEIIEENKNIFIVKVNGYVRYIDLNNRTYSDGISNLTISISNNPNINKIITESIADSDKIVLAKLVTYLIYVHYDYSQVPNEFERPRKRLYSTLAHCQHLAEDITSILKNLGFSVKTVGILSNDSTHAVNEVLIDDIVYTLDPSSGVVFSKSIKQLKENYELPYVLPQVRNLDLLWKKQAIDKIQTINYYD